MSQKNVPLTLFHMDFNFACLSAKYIRQWLEKLAKMGYTGILWELENKVQWETCPECVWPEAMSKEEFREILDYASSLGLESIPLLQTIGHGEYVLLHQKYHAFREQSDEHSCYCTSNPDVRTFLKKWIEEYIDLFGDIRHFHLGGDEVYVFATCPECTRQAEVKGRNGLYAEHLRELSEPLLAHGIRPGIWCDMILHYPSEMDRIPKEFVIWDWNYWSFDKPNTKTRVWDHGDITKEELTPEIKEKYPQITDSSGNLVPFYTADFLKDAGFDVILCSSSRAHGDSVFCPDFEIRYQNVTGVAHKTVQSGLMGQCVTSWAVRLHSLETQELILQLAPRALRDPEKPAFDLLVETATELFGTDPSPFIEAASTLGKELAEIETDLRTIMWSQYKDSRPAPKAYLADRLAELERDAPQKLAGLRNSLSETMESAPSALADLETFIKSAPRGAELIQAWITAGRLQVQYAQLMKQVLSGQPDSSLVPQAQLLKSQYIDWLADGGQTPQSAAKNAGLAYDSLIEWLGSGT